MITKRKLFAGKTTGHLTKKIKTSHPQSHLVKPKKSLSKKKSANKYRQETRYDPASSLPEHRKKEKNNEKAVGVRNTTSAAKTNVKKVPKVKAASSKTEINTKRTKVLKTSPDYVCMPKTPQEYSSNWKTLLQQLESEKKHNPKKGLKKRIQHQEKKVNTLKKEGMTDEACAKPDIWFDDVDDILLNDHVKQPGGTSRDSSQKPENLLVKPQSFNGLTKVLAMDCEMVGVGSGGVDSILARISIVNHFGQCVYDKYVKAAERVTDYRTHVSGVRREDLLKGEEFATVQKEVSDMLKGRVLVGHALHNDLKVLYLDHPKKKIRDTCRYKPFRQLFQGRLPSLKKLTARLLGVSVQEGEHSSVQDAQAAMRLYTMHRREWEKSITTRKSKTNRNKVTT